MSSLYAKMCVRISLHLIKNATMWNVVCVEKRIEEHKHSAIGKHLRDAHNQRNKDLQEQFTILKKCRGKFECLIYEMLFIQEMKPKLNTQSDSIKAKLFST